MKSFKEYLQDCLFEGAAPKFNEVFAFFEKGEDVSAADIAKEFGVDMARAKALLNACHDEAKGQSMSVRD